MNEIEEYCKIIINKYNLPISMPNIEINYKRHRIRGTAMYNGTLIISDCIFEDKSIFKNTIRHELAHFAAYTENGFGHGKTFKKWAKLMNVKETNFSYTRKKWFHFSCECGKKWKARKKIKIKCTCGKLLF